MLSRLIQPLEDAVTEAMAGEKARLTQHLMARPYRTLLIGVGLGAALVLAARVFL